MINRLWTYIAAVAALLAGLLWLRRDAVKDREGRSALKEKRLQEKARESVQREIESTRGLSRRALVDRMRRRSGRWGGV